MRWLLFVGVLLVVLTAGCLLMLGVRCSFGVVYCLLFVDCCLLLDVCCL